MTWFADLLECNYFGAGCAKHLRAVGWLEYGKPFPEASVDGHVLTKLSKLLEDPWQLVWFCGFHICDLCYAPGSDLRSIPHRVTSHRNLFVPGKDTIYVCPEAILHYITEHDYAPPAEFNDAVIGCPPMGSGAYFAALKAQGGKPLVDGTCLKRATPSDIFKKAFPKM
jgi:hypothetical protein